MGPLIQLIYKQSFLICVLLNLKHGMAMVGNNIRDAKANEFPFIVSIGSISDNVVEHLERYHICGGTLITEKHVLTAEHCLIDDDVEDIEVTVGSTDLRRGEKYYPESWITYQDWRDNDVQRYSTHDIAIITLSEKVKNIRPVRMLLCAPSNRPGAKVKTAGWGEGDNGEKSLVLKTADFKLLPLETCESKVRALADDDFYFNQQDMCSSANPWTLIKCGDSGGPLVNEQNTLIGVNVGYCPLVMKLNNSQEYLNHNQVNIHVSIYYYGAFIKHVTKGYLKKF